MHTRREFLAGTLAGLTTASLAPLAFATRPAPPLGVQLYTVRKQVDANLAGTLAAIRKIGYRTVETYTSQANKMTAQELRKAIQDAGLTVPSGHFSYDGFDTKFDYAKQLGLEFVVCSSVPKSIGNSLDGFKRAAEQYNTWGAKAKQMGMQFAFHNHNSEFHSFNGTTGFDELMKETDPALVQWQMDCYWVAEAGQSPVAMLRKYGHRITTLHLKDRKAGAAPSVELNAKSQYFTEIGNGTLDWKKILRLAEKQGVRYMFVEQDTTERPPIESLQISYDNLQKLLS